MAKDVPLGFEDPSRPVVTIRAADRTGRHPDRDESVHLGLRDDILVEWFHDVFVGAGVQGARDMGNIVFDESGRAAIDMIVEGISLNKDAPNGVVGRAVVVHMQRDDLQTDPTGNAGARAACGVIV